MFYLVVIRGLNNGFFVQYVQTSSNDELEGDLVPNPTISGDCNRIGTSIMLACSTVDIG